MATSNTPRSDKPAIPGIDVDTTTAAWSSVRRYAERRMQEMAEIALSPATPDDRRREAAIRHDELAVLLRAPGETIRRASLYADGPAKVY